MLQYQTDPDRGKMKLTVCCSEQEAWDYLNSNQASVADCPKYLYRGQANRHLRLWPPEPRPQQQLTRHQYEVDSIVPTDYRGLEDAVAAGTAHTTPRFRDEAARLRSILTWGAIVEHGENLAQPDHQALMQWLNAQQAQAHRFDAVGSIGQHYGLMTGYTDATSSLAVAFWFATRDFGTGSYAPSGHSVVYRWKLKSLRSVLSSLNNARGWTGCDEARVVDIRDIPPPIGSRPRNQSGWSLVNCELVTVLLELIKSDVIEAVVFPRTGPCPGNCLTRDFIVPPNENIAMIFEEITSGQLFSTVRQREVNDWQRNNQGQLPYINLCDAQFRSWVIK